MLPHSIRQFRRCILVLCLWLCCSAGPVFSQEQDSKLHIFGYMQASFGALDESYMRGGSSTFLLQQLNIMGSRQFDSRFSFFGDLQFTNTFSSPLKWGGINLEEAWIKYSRDQALNVKVGLLTPTFNAMHQIKNKAPLVPYVFRPFVYESVMAEVLDFEGFLPMRAYVEVYGAIPIADSKVEYAVYLGNSDSKFIARDGSFFQVSGMDTTNFKLVGARVGFTTSWLRAGVSFTSDKENHTDMGIGPIQRYRVGGDLSIQFEPITLEGEVILVKPQLDDRGRGILRMVSMMNPLVGSDFDRLFWYGTCLWDISEEFYTYASYSYVANNDNTIQREGIRGWSVGGGWRPIDQIAVKAQLNQLKGQAPPTGFKLTNYILAISVTF
jgi:hypothetical protein